jgi:hypothetical protein
MNMTESNPVLTSPRAGLKGNDDPNRVRAFKAAQVSTTLPSIHNPYSSQHNNHHSHRQSKPKPKLQSSPTGPGVLDKPAGLSRRSSALSPLAFEGGKRPLRQNMSQAPAQEQPSTTTLLKLPSAQKRKVTKGVMGYAEELFEMRRKQQEIKQYRRNMVETTKFTF